MNGEMLYDQPVSLLREAALSMTTDERSELVRLETFSNTFKQLRIKYGFTQGDVGVALGRRYGSDFSQTTISRFEAGNLSYKNMCKLRPLMDEWLCDMEIAISSGVNPNHIIDHGIPVPATRSNLMRCDEKIKKRRKRTSLDLQQQNVLEIVFSMNQRPSNEHMGDLADQLKLSRDVVRVWFCNRRQKLRRAGVNNSSQMDITGQQALLHITQMSNQNNHNIIHCPPHAM